GGGRRGDPHRLRRLRAGAVRVRVPVPARPGPSRLAFRRASRRRAVSVPRLVALSAGSPEALERATDALVESLERGAFPDAPSAVAAAHRRAVVAGEPAEAAHYLRRRDARRVATGAAAPGRPVAFLFPGVGDQYPGMAGGLYRHVPVFAAELDRCLRRLEADQGLDLRPILYPANGDAGRRGPDLAALFDRSETAERIHDTLVAQPLVFALQSALAAALRAVGVRPAAPPRHSPRGYPAAAAAGRL